MKDKKWKIIKLTNPPVTTPPPLAIAELDIIPAAYDPAVIPAEVNPTAERIQENEMNKNV